MEKYLHLLSRGDKIGLTLIRLSIAIVFMWIGLLKFVPYEADSITPFVANSPLMSFFYEHPEDYKQYLTHEGEYKPEARAWQLHTTADNIWAMGDVTGGLQFTYISLDDYRIVRDELLGEGKRSTDDRKNVPYSVFMTPPLSRVGMTEEQARESGADIQVVTLPVAAIPRARVMNDTRGVLKAIVDNKTQRMLGASLLCVDSHEMINIVKMVMDAGLPYSILRDQIFTHPSMSESLNDLFSLVK